MRTIALLALSLLSACQPGEAPASAGSPAVALAPADLAGAYRVAAVDGGPIDQPQAMTATITAARIDVQSGCIRFAYAYTLADGMLSTTSAPVASCRRALTPVEQAVQQGLAAATEVVRTPENGVRFAGAGRSVTLFGQ